MLTNSWIITRKDTGAVVAETFNEEVAAKINREKYNVQPAHEYLVQLNKRIKDGNIL